MSGRADRLAGRQRLAGRLVGWGRSVRVATSGLWIVGRGSLPLVHPAAARGSKGPFDPGPRSASRRFPSEARAFRVDAKALLAPARAGSGRTSGDARQTIVAPGRAEARAPAGNDSDGALSFDKF